MPLNVPFEYDRPSNTVEALRLSISNRLVYAVGKDLRTASQHDWLSAVTHAVRDRLMNSWRESLARTDEQDAKQVYYLSLEFLIGR